MSKFQNAKSNKLYLYILGTWLTLILLTLPSLIMAVQHSERAGWVVYTLVIISSLFISYFWLNGMKDFVYTLYYHFNKDALQVPRRSLWPLRKGTTTRPEVVMVYCTYNDFNAESLLKSMHQDYPNYKVVILDDSTKITSKRQIDRFGEAHDIKIVRREGHEGFKAGNLNNYLKRASFDYFVILDSDEIVPSNFITRSLDYFAQRDDTGIVQANHIATRNRNPFMRLFALGVDSHWPAYQSVKDGSGFLSLLGHGAMVSRSCYEAVGGFPHLVAEDLCFSIEARNKGYYVAFAPDIICEEEYPVNYLAFKKRHSKWTQGNMEFIKTYTLRILTSKMTWFEKLDIVLFTYNLPLTAFFAIYVIINVIVLPVLDYDVTYPLWMLFPTVAFLFAPMLNDMITYRGKISAGKMSWYLAHSFLLYGSMLFISIVASTKSLFGKSVFTVTPKDDTHTSVTEAVWANKGELGFGLGLSATALAVTGSILPVLLIIVPSFLSVYVALMSNEGEQLIAEREVA